MALTCIDVLVYCLRIITLNMQSQADVLVADDDPDSRTLLSLMISAAGYSVVTACNGAEALQIARSHGPRVILLDLAMPVMDGFCFRAEQLRDPKLARIPVLCVSGRHDAAEVARRLNVAGCVAKPFDLDAVVERVRLLLGRAATSEAALLGSDLECRQQSAITGQWLSQAAPSYSGT